MYALDQDDLVAPGALTALADALDSDATLSVVWGKEQDFGERVTFEPHARTLDPWLITYVNGLPVNSLVRREALETAGGWQACRGYEDWSLWMAFAEHGLRGSRVDILQSFYRVTSTGMLSEVVDRHADIMRILHERHRALFEARGRNRRRSSAPLRCKILFPVIERLPVGEFTRHRMYRRVNDPVSSARARLLGPRYEPTGLVGRT